ncbi:mannitol dehydrogenase family protein [Quadrisphaera sp. DSM 44207]|uniref:mannitol dehydrogenase family protein n=1 Tax=Quadrisphaera sp. DSM 44207 TaxID=1881057 RepID=UPI0008868965|nr:mannitol dehydrogenase family protein [Quadrisphaera sp. DSM 44207]SDQ33964.1 fructuronate reductase/mannitol 2-dehydrogenase [Quadrisphaera sp. DSM 44207]
MSAPAPTPTLVPLTSATLSALPPGVSVPTYDRSALTPSVVHIGVGGFHRAHQAVYLDDLACQGVTDWGLVGVGLHRPEMGQVLSAQDCLYLLVERGADGDRARVIGSMVRYLFAPEDPEAVLAALADERTRLVTLTITGTGYRIDPHTGEFDPDDEEVAADLEDPARPRTVFGYLVEALDRRRRAGLAGFTVLSCDNMQDNGSAARTAVLSFAALRDRELAAWIADHVAFPSSMVDRITPNTSPQERDAIAAATGVDARWPVVTEPFSHWVVEDSFVDGRPPLERVGVQLTPDVHPYEVVKTRLLNASHSALAYLGHLAGHRSTDQVMADPLFRAYLTRMMAEEIAPSLPQVPGIDLAEYQRTVLERLANPRMGDQLGRLCRRGSTKIPNYVLPSVRAALEQDRPHQLLGLAVAGWLRFLRGYDYAGREILVEGPMRDRLVPLAQQGREDPELLLRERKVFGDLAQDTRFAAAVEVALRALEEQGPREVIAFYLGEGAEAAA